MLKVHKAEIVKIEDDFTSAINMARKLYLEGAVFIYPTDTIYGFGANPFNQDASVKINYIKGRDLNKRYILLIDDIQTLLKYVNINSEKHLDFLLSIWPNPISVVLNLNSKTKDILKLKSAAFRIPNHRFCQKLLSKLKMPLISTSVNRSSQKPLVEPSIIQDEFSSDVDTIFYTEKKSYFEASTLIDLSGAEPLLLREGKIKFEDIVSKFK